MSTERSSAVNVDTLPDLIERCERFAKIIEGITVVSDDWQPGGPERREPRETLLEAAEALRNRPAQQPGKAYEAARANLREAWAALAMIRETVETLAPSGAVKAAEHLDGPTFTHEADALVEGIIAIVSTITSTVQNDVENTGGGAS